MLRELQRPGFIPGCTLLCWWSLVARALLQIVRSVTMQIRHLQDEIKERFGLDAARRLALRRSRLPQPQTAHQTTAEPVTVSSRAQPMMNKVLLPRSAAAAAAAAAAAPSPTLNVTRVKSAVTEPVPASSSCGQLSQAQIAELPPLARTRFATDGLPVGWIGEDELLRGTQAKEVVSRDPLRMHEGSVPTGYTIEEALVLLGCSFTALQRAGVPSGFTA
jgi:hypothetical protein